MWAAFSLDSAPASGSKRRDLIAALTGAAAWFSAGTVAYTSGGADRVAALPPLSLLAAAMALAIVIARVVRLQLRDAWPLAISFLLFLPFLPGSIPPALMLLAGPIEVIVWTLVGTGVIVARTGSTAYSLRAPWFAAGLVAVLSLVAFNQVRAVVPSGDEPHYLVATQSLIGDRDLKVENNYAAGNYLDYFGGRLQPHYLQRSASGEIYSIHAPGVSVIVLPAFLIAGYMGAVATVIAIAALTAALTWTVAHRVSQSAAAAWLGTVSVFATAPFLFHSFTIYPDGIGALTIMLAIWLIARLADGEHVGQPTLVAVGAGLAVLPWLHTRFAILAAILGLAVIAQLATRRIRPTRIAAFLLVPAVSAAAWFAFFWIIWGTPNPMAPYGRDTESSLSYIGRGLSGLLFDQQHGVLGTAPVYAIALLGLWALFKQRKPLAITIALAVTLYVLAVSTYAMWWGGTSGPGRFVAALLPLAAVLIAMAWSRYPQARATLILLLVVSLALVIPRLTEESGRFVFNSRSAFDPTIEWLSRNVDLSQALPSTHRDGPGVALRDALPWVTAIGIVLFGSLTLSRTRHPDHGMLWTLTAYGAAIVSLAAVVSVWTMRGVNPVTAERSMLGALTSERQWQTLLVDATRWRRISPDEFSSRLAIEGVADQSAALIRLRRVPAGEYEITAVGAAPLTVVVKRNDSPLESASAPFRLHLPVALSTLSVRVETTAASGSQALRITPVAVAPSAVSGRPALRGTRYGRARVFAFDERVYLEPRGFWTRAEGRATIVIDADEEARRAGLPISITGGAAATTIGISVGEWSQSYSMTPGQRRDITLPPLTGARAWVVDIHSGPGSRPFEREPGNNDVRALAAWFEIP